MSGAHCDKSESTNVYKYGQRRFDVGAPRHRIPAVGGALEPGPVTSKLGIAWRRPEGLAGPRPPLLCVGGLCAGPRAGEFFHIELCGMNSVGRVPIKTRPACASSSGLNLDAECAPR